MFEILKSEFKRNKTSFAIYSIVTLSLMWLYVALFPSIKESSEQINSLMKALPENALAAFGIYTGGFDTLEKFLALETMTIMWPLIITLLSISRAGSCIAGDIEHKTIGMSLSIPISRKKLFLSKCAGNTGALASFTYISILSIILFSKIHSISLDIGNIFLTLVLCLVFMKCVFSVALMFSSFSSEKGRAYSIAGGFVMLSYVANVIAQLSESLNWIKHLSIFYYFKPSDPLVYGNLSIKNVLIFLSVSLVTTLIGMYNFEKRDISI